MKREKSCNRYLARFKLSFFTFLPSASFWVFNFLTDRGCFKNVREPAGQVCFERGGWNRKEEPTEGDTTAHRLPLCECLSEDSNLSQSSIVECHHRCQTSWKPWGTSRISGKPSPHLPQHPPCKLDKDGEETSQQTHRFLFSPLSLTIPGFSVIPVFFNSSGTITWLYTVSPVLSMLLFVLSWFPGLIQLVKLGRIGSLFQRNVLKNAKKIKKNKRKSFARHSTCYEHLASHWAHVRWLQSCT